ncbi:MAG: CapA family protein [Erysipelotrichaceae bacterium]|nr:CapA family protein [Erysipelotrichaceae bacterium]
MNKIILLLLTLLMINGAVGCSHEQDHDIYIIYTNDIHANARGENIGLAGVKAFKDSYVNSHTYVSMVDCGDFSEGTEYGSVRCGHYMVMLMNDCGYDVVALGNQDFDYGISELQQMIDQANFDIVDCNIKYTGSGTALTGYSPYVIKSYGYTKVAFIGVMTPDILTTGKPAYHAICENDEIVYDFYQGTDGQDLWDQVQKTVDQVRKKVDYVIVLSHLGIETKSEPYTSFEMIANTTGIDAVIDGHSHTVNSGEAVLNKNGEEVCFTSTGKNIENIGVMILKKDHTFQTVLYPYVDERDPFILAELDDIDAEIKERGGN